MALYIFMLAAIAGHVIISRVPVILHTPLMSGSNFIHGIVLIGAMVVLGHADTTLEKVLGFIAVFLGADEASYWRLTALEQYDAERSIWTSRGTYRSTDGDLGETVPGRPLTQEVRIATLGGLWLPAAFQAVDVTGDVLGVTMNAVREARSFAIGALPAWKTAGTLRESGSIRRAYLGIRSQPSPLGDGLREAMGRAQSSGLDLRWDAWHVWTIEDGLITRSLGFLNEQSGRQAAEA